MHKHSNNISLIPIVLLLFWHSFLNLVWIYLNTVPPTWDAALHTILSFKMEHYILDHLYTFSLQEFLKISEYYPPFVHFTGMIVGWLTLDSYKSLQIVGSIYFIISIYFLYRYTEQLFKNREIAFGAAFFYSFFLTNYQQSRDFMLDIPSIVCIMGALYYQEKSNHFQKTRESILYFVFVGLSLLTKWTSVFFLLIPFFFTLKDIFFSHTHVHKKKVFMTMIIGGIIIFLISAPWYMVNIKRFIEISSVTAIGELADPQNLLSLENVLFNANLLFMYQITYPGVFFLLFAFILFMRGADKRKKFTIVGTILFTYIVFTVISNKNIRYTMPLTPFIAIIMGYGLYQCLRKGASFLKTYIGATVVLFYIFVYLILSFGFPFYPEFRLGVKLPVLGDVDFLYLHEYPVKIMFDRSDWHNRTILYDIGRLSGNRMDKDTIVLNLVDREYMNWYNLDPALYNDVSPVAKKTIKLSFVPFIAPHRSDTEMNTYLTDYIDYVLVPEKQIGLKEAIREYDHMYRFQQFMLEGKALNFEKVASYHVPGNVFYLPDTYYLYKKQTSPVGGGL